MKTLIYKNSELEPLPMKIVGTCITIFFWGIWLYLWMPLIDLVWSALGFGNFASNFKYTLPVDYSELQRAAIFYGSIICALSAVLLLWARIDYLRFRHSSRRLRPQRAALAELAASGGHSARDVGTWQSARRLIAHHDAIGGLRFAEISNPHVN